VYFVDKYRANEECVFAVSVGQVTDPFADSALDILIAGNVALVLIPNTFDFRPCLLDDYFEFLQCTLCMTPDVRPFTARFLKAENTL
jgi:hypothetical protein